METEAREEINLLLEEFGDNVSEINNSGLSGLLTCKTSLDPLDVVQKIKKIVQDDPWKVRYLLRLIPIDIVVNTDLIDIKNAAKDLANRIDQSETFRVTVEKRSSKIHSNEIIEAIATVIDRKVSLEKHDWVILVEVIGKETGVSVIKPENIFSAVKVKRESPQ
ncbi:MAG: THUMP domain-containing protein [Nitrososphaerales archaeon]